MRGTRAGRVRPHHVNRFIPACAGNTELDRLVDTPAAVHPRLCGEHAWRPPRVLRLDGSSPPVRGTPKAAAETALTERFIPACAGNTCDRAVEPRGAPVHPRLCGEHAKVVDTEPLNAGSSPPVRGTQGIAGLSWVAPRFIPACAGNTPRIEPQPRREPVHPRLCGEHPSRPAVARGKCGSSPPVRGTPWIARRGNWQRRFIPACAGNTWQSAGCIVGGSVHPRLCGEHGCTTSSPLWSIGSSPPVRGTLDDQVDAASAARFIPACAGNTHTNAPRQRTTPVHPRLCGEH